MYAVVCVQVMSTSSKLITYALAHNGTIPTRIPKHEELVYLDERPKRIVEEVLSGIERVAFVRNPYAR